MAAVEPTGSAGNGAGIGVPRGVRRRSRRPQAAVVHEPVDVCVCREAAVHHGRLEVSSLGVLALPLVRVLVAAQSLRRREVSATVVALESPAALSVVVAAVVAVDVVVVVAAVAVVVFDDVVIGVSGFGLVDGGRIAVSAAEFFAEKANTLLFNGSRTNKGKLREGLDVHEIMGLPLMTSSTDLVHDKKKLKKKGYPCLVVVVAH